MNMLSQKRHGASFIGTAPFVICFLLLLLPYFFPLESQLFRIELFRSNLFHALACSAIIGALAMSAFLGFRLSRSAPSKPLEVHRLYVLAAWILFSVALAANVFIAIAGSIAYLQGGYQAARSVLPFNGVGVLFRLYMLAMPILAVSLAPKRFLLFFATLGIFVVLRATIISERTAMLELAVTAVICLQVGRIKLPRWAFVGVAGLMLLLFANIFTQRLVQQDRNNIRSVERSALLPLVTTLAYYSDTMNKYYLVADGKLQYPFKAWREPLAAFSPNNASIARMEKLLGETALQTRAIVTIFNNPGGLAQDASDFGLLGGLFFGAMKFALCGLVIGLIWRSIVGLMLSPIAVVQVLEYPRFNYIELPYAFLITSLGVLIICGVATISNRRRRLIPVGRRASA